MIHTRAAEDDTFAVLREHAGSVPAVVMHCFSAPDRLEECVERSYMCSFAGNVTYPKATDLQEAARQVPDELLLVETDSPYLAPQPVRGKPNEPRTSRTPRGSWRSCAASRTRSSSARWRRTSSASSGRDRRAAPPSRAPPAAAARSASGRIASSARTS